ncbi:hypothetical protein FPZ12_026270 [Amycolatopsis acidicola]|uniref:GNAT family N-acetyltransferase n=1 Tax=Amycolatopsis acidicola TaxID=2596893 RepID=A0A5N0UX03_9PSEU|nr:hypothetical protein [Amycolatopsis acidicola]KAA9156925.1 hypothetical protein FPZ12_026270 [Amycolatopsis acidicola]
MAARVGGVAGQGAGPGHAGGAALGGRGRPQWDLAVEIDAARPHEPRGYQAILGTHPGFRGTGAGFRVTSETRAATAPTLYGMWREAR